MTDETGNQGIPEPEGDVTLVETDYEIGQDNIVRQIGPFGLDIHNPVFLISSLSIIAFVFYTLAFQDQAGAIFSGMRDWLTSTLDWFFIGAANVFVVFCLFLIVSPLGKVRLGGKDATPDYSYIAWFAMLFAAGMGIGLMFFGVGEPISHYTSSFGGTAMENGVRTEWAPLGGGRYRGRHAAGHGRHHFPLGPAPLGDLCGGGAGAGAVLLQQGSAANDPLCVSSDLRRGRLGLDRPCHRHSGGVRDAVRPGDLAWLRRAAGQCRADLSVRNARFRGV
jgi:hypothetical protein